MYCENGKGYFATMDCSSSTPLLNYNNIIELSDNIYNSNTVFYNNKYYCFYNYNGAVYRKIFTVLNNAISIESNALYSNCDEIDVIDENYIMEIRNNIPYFVQKHFYE